VSNPPPIPHFPQDEWELGDFSEINPLFMAHKAIVLAISSLPTRRPPSLPPSLPCVVARQQSIVTAADVRQAEKIRRSPREDLRRVLESPALHVVSEQTLAA